MVGNVSFSIRLEVRRPLTFKVDLFARVYFCMKRLLFKFLKMRVLKVYVNVIDES